MNEKINQLNPFESIFGEGFFSSEQFESIFDGNSHTYNLDLAGVEDSTQAASKESAARIFFARLPWEAKAELSVEDLLEHIEEE